MDLIDEANNRLGKAGIAPELLAKWQALIRELASYHSAVIAYSGGVDSSFLAYAASLVLKTDFVAVTIVSPLEPPDIVKVAAGFAAQHGFKHVMIPNDVLQISEIRANHPDRCYHCKTNIMHLLWGYARENDYEIVLEGENADDQHDFRPGRKAVEESATLSPLAQCGLTKTEIRRLARVFNLIIWDQPSSPCLASRFPYGMELTKARLDQVALGEDFLHRKGFKVVRVRHHGDVARIEIEPDQFETLLDLRQEIFRYFRQIGFQYIALDLQGYRLGSMNEGLAS